MRLLHAAMVTEVKHGENVWLCTKVEMTKVGTREGWKKKKKKKSTISQSTIIEKKGIKPLRKK